VNPRVHLLFDLDGTLTDPFPGITGSILHALAAMGRVLPTAEELRWCIGPPLTHSFEILLGPDEAHLAATAVGHYRERYGSIGLFENKVIPGIREALDELKLAGHTMSVATSKPTVFAERIIDHFGLRSYFQAVYGSELDGTRTDKTSLIAYIIGRESIQPEEAIMIGDRKHDIIGASANGIPAFGVLWGYGSEEELTGEGASACVASPQDLAAAVNAAVLSSAGTNP
jgi:phosphoglycolate phosphatase